MKKFSVLAVFVVLSMVLAACAGGGENTTPTAVGGGFATEVPGGGLPTEALPTEPLATEPVATEVVPGTDLTPVGTTVGTNIPATGEKDINRLKNLLDFHVIDSQNNDLGEVDDMIIDTTGAQIHYVVLGSGGFLGIGQREILIPWNLLKVGVDNNNNNAFIFDGTSDQLTNVPDANLDELDFTNPTWDEVYTTYWNNPGAAGTSVAGTPAPSMTDMVQPTAEAGTAVVTSSNIMRGDAVNFTLASKLVIADVVDETTFNAGGGAAGTVVPGTEATPAAAATSAFTNDSGMTTGTSVAGTGVTGTVNDYNVVGEVTDAIVDPATGQVSYLIVDAGDALNVGDKWIPVPLSAAKIVYKADGDNNILVLVDANRLAQAPNFDVDALPNTSTTGWDADLVTYWGVTR